MRATSDASAPIKVAFMIDAIQTDLAGTEKQLLGILQHLPRVRVTPSVICLQETAWLREHGLPCDVHVLGYTGLLSPSLVRVFSRLRRLIRRERFDVLHVLFEESVYVALLAVGGMRPRPALIANRRDIGLGARRPWYHRVFAMVRPRFMRRFDLVLANAEAVKRHLMMTEGLLADRIRVAYNGIDFDLPFSERPPLLADRHADVWVAIAASLTPVKRHDVLLSALGILKRKYPGTRIGLLVLGDGPESPGLRRRAAELGLDGDVVFAGAVRDVPTYLRCADIGVLCSDREGFSNAILEYMACGLPVIATDVGGNPELVTDETGLRVRPNDPDALARAIALLAADAGLREGMARRARERVAQKFNWNASVSVLERCYREALDLKSRLAQ